MKTDPSLAPPSFSSEEGLHELFLEGIHSEEGTVMTPAEWQKLHAELGPQAEQQHRAS